MKEHRKSNGKKKASSRGKKNSKKKTAHMQKVAERKAAVNEKLCSDESAKPVRLSWGSRKVLREINQSEQQLASKLNGNARMFQKGVNKSTLPDPNDREAVRKYYRQLIGAPPLPT